MKTLTLTIKAVFDNDWKLITKDSDISTNLNMEKWEWFSLDNFSKALDFGTTIILWSAVDEAMKQWMEQSKVAMFFARYLGHLLESFALINKGLEEERWISSDEKEKDIKDLIDEVNSL